MDDVAGGDMAPGKVILGNTATQRILVINDQREVLRFQCGNGQCVGKVSVRLGITCREQGLQ
jgi:hypothetical protein